MSKKNKKTLFALLPLIILFIVGFSFMPSWAQSDESGIKKVTSINDKQPMGGAGNACGKDSILSISVANALACNLKNLYFGISEPHNSTCQESGASPPSISEDLKFYDKVACISNTWVEENLIDNDPQYFRLYFGEAASGDLGLVVIDVWENECEGRFSPENTAFWIPVANKISDNSCGCTVETISTISKAECEARTANFRNAMPEGKEFVQNWTFKKADFKTAVAPANNNNSIADIFQLEFGMVLKTNEPNSFNELDPIWHVFYRSNGSEGSPCEPPSVSVNASFVDWASPCPPYCKGKNILTGS